MICTCTVRVRGRVSKSSSTICCHAPSVIRPPTMGMVSEGPQQRGAQVRMSVIVVPTRLVRIRRIARNQSLQQRRHVLLQARLVLDGRDGGSGANHKHRRDAVHDARLQKHLLDAPCDVEHVVVAPRGDREPPRVDHPANSVPVCGALILPTRLTFVDGVLKLRFAFLVAQAQHEASVAAFAQHANPPEAPLAPRLCVRHTGAGRSPRRSVRYGNQHPVPKLNNTVSRSASSTTRSQFTSASLGPVAPKANSTCSRSASSTQPLSSTSPGTGTYVSTSSI
jgi:hypothetical protein